MATNKFRVYNSLTQQKEVFTPLVPGKVGIYVCRVTTYDFSHIGHGRAAVVFDILYRYLRYLGYEITYVRNFTDIDDKIIRRANEVGEDPLSLSSRFCNEYIKDMEDLQCLLPTHQPRVSEHMELIKDMITQIINNGCGYVVDGDVFFAVDKSPNYGRLSGQKLEDNRAGERVAVDSRKRNPADFALWKSAKPDEPSWESPWGPGRPGWHIECSAMSVYYLSFKFDIHGGGIDLIFPHHENEIAQSCGACQESGISYWIHNGHVTNNNEKMSKSLNNFFTIREATKSYHPLALRHFLMSSHYRSPLSYTVLQLEISSDAVYYIYKTLQDSHDAVRKFREGGQIEENGEVPKIDPKAQISINELRKDFENKMSDDLNVSPILTGDFLKALTCINNLLKRLKKMQKQQQLSSVQSLIELEKEIKQVLDILGLLSPDPYSTVVQQLKDRALKRANLVEDDVLRLIEERKTARQNKDYDKSDWARNEMTAKGISLEDECQDGTWRPCVPKDKEVKLRPTEHK